MKNPTPKNKPDKFIPYSYPISIKEKLSRDFIKRKLDFFDVLLTRRSSPIMSSISLESINELLYFSNKVQYLAVDDFGFLTTKRTAPSAGARHPIDLLISRPELINNRTIEYYNPIDHSLGELSISESKINSFLLEINSNLLIENCCVIWFSIQVEKTSSKYENAESLYWRDSGALLYCIQLIANYLGLKSCPFGSLASKSFDNLLESNNLISGGGILIGT